ncbi:MAG: capsular biosynthesis protein [Nitrospinae bacterium]|nr:capsular biosynthesis protein [Nitrospinota bacterium]
MPGKRLKAALVSSHGGHLTELLALRDVFNGHETFFVTYEGTTPSGLPHAYYLQKFHTNPFSFLAVLFKTARILWKERPDVIFSTGAEIAAPLFFVGKLFGCKLIYLECSAQVTTPSLTGRLVYPIADRFFVQWEPLARKYGPKAVCKGGLI